MPSPSRPSVPRTVAAVALVLVIGVVLGLLGLPSIAVVIFVSGAGTGAIMRHLLRRRAAGAGEMAATASVRLDDFPVQIPADRVAVGRLVQIRLLPPTRSVYAPGVFCAARGQVTFVPSGAKWATRAWSGPVEEIELHRLQPKATVARVRSREGDAQFVLYAPIADVRRAIDRYLPIAVTS